MRYLIIPAVLALAAGAQTSVSDWPQFLGPERNGVYRGPALAETWPSSGPRVVWQKQVGQGFSGPVVAQGRVILFHRVSDREVVESLDARTGAPQWQYGYPTSYRDDFGFDEGPRAVPVVANGVVYTFGAEGQLHAISLATGTRIWSEDTMRRFGVAKGFFGAGGLSAGRGRKGHCQHRRTRRRHRGLRRQDRQGSVDGHRRRSQLFVAESAPRSADAAPRFS